jgi:hypothetical protein
VVNRAAVGLVTALAGAAMLGGCSLVTDSFVTNEFSGDPYPIQVETDSGAVIVGVRQGGANDRAAVLDVLSPVSIVDRGPNGEPRVTSSDLTLLGVDATGALAQPRAKFPDAEVITLHPCTDPQCNVGTELAPRPFEAIIGASALAGDAVRFRLSDKQVFVLADVAGDDVHRAAACDAVFPAPYRGGGTLVISGTELPFGGRRIALQACLGAPEDPLDPALTPVERGADALLVMSTGIGVSILGESAYQRYTVAHKTALPLASLPIETVLLPSGPVVGRHAVIERIALAASSGSSPRAPCRQVYAHHFMMTGDCTTGDDCPCETAGDTFCGVPAVVELHPTAGIDVLVVGDDDRTLQALRTELRPNQAEVDGILGTGAIGTVEVDVDYPNNRVLARCAIAGCDARPALTERGDRAAVGTCIGSPPAGPIVFDR